MQNSHFLIHTRGFEATTVAARGSYPITHISSSRSYNSTLTHSRHDGPVGQERVYTALVGPW